MNDVYLALFPLRAVTFFDLPDAPELARLGRCKALDVAWVLVSAAMAIAMSGHPRRYTSRSSEAE